MVEKVFLEGAQCRGETIELGCHKYVDFVFGGTTLNDCILDIHGSGRGFQLFNVTIRNSHIKVRRTLRNYRFTGVLFENCIFAGNFYSCEWGRRPDEDYPDASVSYCDFSATTLDLCSFFDCHVDTLRWPGWPNIVILEPWQHRQDWLSIVFPPTLRLTQEMIGNVASLGRCALSETLSKAIRAETVNLSDRYYDVDPDNIWPLIQDRSYIVFEGKTVRPRVKCDLSAIQAENTLAASKADIKLRHIRFWRLLARAKIIDIELKAPRNYRVTVDTSFLRQRVHSAPERVIVELRDCDEFQVMEGDTAISELEKPLTIRGADWMNGSVLISAFGKRRIVTRYGEWQLYLADETPLSDKELDGIVETYYAF